jgi:hypothetical protein
MILEWAKEDPKEDVELLVVRAVLLCVSSFFLGRIALVKNTHLAITRPNPSQIPLLGTHRGGKSVFQQNQDSEVRSCNSYH